MIKVGPAGLGGVKEAEKNLEYYKENNLDSCEIAFTYGVYIKNNKDAERIGNVAKKLNISLSIHAPYYVNLASKEKAKVIASKKRILEACERGHYLKANYVVFHCGFYQDGDKELVYQIIKKEILDMQNIIKKNKWDIKLAPETTGKKTQFGDLDELLRLHKETGCFLCIDFAHLLARENKIDYDEILNKLKNFKSLHVHFSGIEYTLKGERRHLITKEHDIKVLLEKLSKHKVNATIINESPDPVGDSIKTRKILEKL